MIINRHNYEELFMLYADNELSVADKQAVEQFVAENIDLKAEFNLIQQLILRPEEDSISFDQKELLYKSASDEITTVNAEEHFLLYIDNELTSKQKTQVETFVLQNPSLQENFTQLKQTILPAEKIVCPDKASLYKKEEKPVIYLWMRRIAVAAVFLALSIAVWMLSSNNNSSLQTDVTAKKTTPAPIQSNNGDKKEAVKSEQNNNFSVTPLLPEKNINSDFATTAKKLVQKSNTIIPPIVTQENKQEVDIKDAVVITDPEPVKKNETVATETTNSVNNSTSEAKASELTNVVEKQTEPASNQTETNYAKQAAYKQLDTDDDRKTLYVGAVELNKDKIRGFLRKAGSIFRSKTRTEDDKIQVASFAINTKEPK